MNDNLEILKKHWQTPNLIFIAIFTKINNNLGYFNQFSNPVNKRRIVYPVIEGTQLDDKRVSFPYSKVTNLKNGAYYKVELSHTNHPKGKNNPFSKCFCFT